MAFIVMVFHDSEPARKYFCYLYLVHSVASLVIGWLLLRDKLTSDETLKKACDDLKRHNYWADHGWKTVDECQEYILNAV